MAKKKPAVAGQGYKLRTLNYYDETMQKEKADRDGENYGVANGLKLTHFLNELFYANYDAQLKDDELTAALEAEFPNKAKFQPIGSYRAYYNANVHGFGHGEPLTADERLKAFRDPKPEKEKKVAATKGEDGKAANKKKAAKKKA